MPLPAQYREIFQWLFYKAELNATEEYHSKYATLKNALQGDDLRLLENISEPSNPNQEGSELNPENWYTDKHTFSPHLCATDYLRAHPDVKTEYSELIHQFTVNRWLKDAEGYIKSRLEKSGRLVPQQINTAVDAIRNITRIVDPDKIDIPMETIFPLPEDTIPVIGGLLNLKTKEMRSHTAQYFYTEALPRKYVKGAIPTTLLYLLDKIFTNDPQAELKKAQCFETIAWTLMKNYNIHGAVIFYGQGGEGKSILQAVIEDLLVYTTSITLGEIEHEKFKRAELYGSWANIVAESSRDVVTSEWFKRTTDGSTIVVDRKNGHPFKFASHAKDILSVNELPERENELRSYYRRIVAIIDFLTTLEQVMTPPEIDAMAKKLKEPEELDAIFSYVVDIFYQPLTERMKFTQQLSTSEAETKWEERSNPAVPYIRLKLESDEILTDVETAEATIKSLGVANADRYFARDKEGLTPYLVTIKDPVVRAAIRWANNKGFPGKKINSTALGRALVTNGFPNISVYKKTGKSVFVAWKDIAILPDSFSDGSNGSNGKGPSPSETTLPPKRETNSDGSSLYSSSWERSNTEENKEESTTEHGISSDSTEKKGVMGGLQQTITGEGEVGELSDFEGTDDLKRFSSYLTDSNFEFIVGGRKVSVPTPVTDVRKWALLEMASGYHFVPMNNGDLGTLFFRYTGSSSSSAGTSAGSDGGTR